MADHCRQQVIVQPDTHAAFVPFAIPVGVPVASIVPGAPLYSVNPAYSQPVPQIQQPQAQTAEDVFAEFQAFLEWKKSRAAQAAPVSLTNKYCNSCHGPQSSNTGARSHVMLEALTETERNAGAKAVLLGTMPPSAAKNPLPPAERDALVLELLGPKPAKTEWKPDKLKPQSLPQADVPPEPKRS